MEMNTMLKKKVSKAKKNCTKTTLRLELVVVVVVVVVVVGLVEKDELFHKHNKNTHHDGLCHHSTADKANRILILRIGGGGSGGVGGGSGFHDVVVDIY
jgi:hypothetical protein